MKTFDKTNVCGVFIGKWNAICCTNNTNNKILKIDGGEIESFRNSTEKKRKNILISRPYCGQGSVGHGYKTRVKPVEKYGGKISNFRDTINHRYSKAVINYAVENACGTIIVEDLKNVSKDDKTLKNWSYFDLQEKIRYKAKEKNIDVASISSKGKATKEGEEKTEYYKTIKTRCSKCDQIDENATNNKEIYSCHICNKKTAYDINISRNLVKAYQMFG